MALPDHHPLHRVHQWWLRRRAKLRGMPYVRISALEKDSQHAQTMQPPPNRVLGDFHDVSSAMPASPPPFRRDGEFMVRTDGPDGTSKTTKSPTPSACTPCNSTDRFSPTARSGVGIAWDSRLKEQGGQRWFHLYPDQNLTHKDPLHWTGLQQNWNYMCAECHPRTCVKLRSKAQPL